MNFINFEVGNENYKLRLNTKNIVALEKQIGRNPVSIFLENGVERIPTVTEMVAILHASLQQYNHGITLSDAYDLFDKYLEDHASTDFVPTIIEIYKASGIIARDSKEEEEVKND